MASNALRHESLTIGGARVAADRVLEVLNPYTGAVVGTVDEALDYLKQLERSNG